ncbi:elongation factor G [Rhodovulum adriaticum]|uniref:Elongation factor G n=1 Tax=Rhodovulum adriaticum TaxID=35804 RepID=A0A4R2NY66_RHOAD|nr:elongation factor G [Rhodovulum adriaticum]MBK1634297.1 elongation factor G [Rhodovulum adriaticum]TCP27150.1 elongation factor G [Rhodovulum adriaticum]
MRCFTILGPSQAGKTTLLNALSALEGRATAATFTDALSVRQFTYLDEPWAGFDITGGPDYLGQAGEALAASDAAVLCVGPDPQAAVLAAPYLRLVEESGVPCFVFINKMDLMDARIRDIVGALQAYAQHHIILRQAPIRDAEGHVTGAVDLISERAFQYQEGQPSRLVEIPAHVQDREQEARADLLEHLADYDDHLMEELIEDRDPAPEEIYSVLAEAHRDNRVMAAYLGAAGHGNGLTRLMKALRHEAPGMSVLRARLRVADPLAIGVAADTKRHVGKSILIRALGTGIQHAAPLAGDTIGNLSGIDGKPVAEPLAPGTLAVAVKSDHLNPGLAYTAQDSTPLPGWTHGRPPAYARLLSPANERDDARLSAALARMAASDPGMETTQDPATGQLLVWLQGPIHLRRVLAKLAEDFGIAAEEHPVSGIYRETITKPVDTHHRHRKQSGGAGQFADVQVTVRPQGRGAGFAFDETVKGGAVPRNYIPAVEAGAQEAMVRGPLGFPVVDVAVTLTDGKHHAVDSSDHAFRTAARNGVREALEQAGAVVLQPIDRVDIHVPSVYSGSLVALASSLKGQVLGFEAHPRARGWDVFQALIPAAAKEELFQALGGLSHGTAWFEARFDHYEELHGKEADRVRQARAEELA